MRNFYRELVTKPGGTDSSELKVRVDRFGGDSGAMGCIRRCVALKKVIVAVL